MTAIRAIIRNGRIETADPIALPEGAEFFISLPVPDGENDDWDNSLDPLKFTEQELAALEADRRSRKEWERAHYEERAEQLRKVWE